MHRGDVRPAEVEDEVNEGSSLVLVRGHHAQEVLVVVLVAEVHAGGGVADLGDVEDLQQVLDLDGGRAGAGSYETSDRFEPPCRAVLPRRRVRLPVGLTGYGVLYEVYALFQGHGGVPARVPDVPAERDVGQDVGIAVDFVQG